ncbi:MAG TPA: ABC transporter permease [Dehalococcoidia bacterium]|nr:ABC transporter permease [Dehalococcoidia bacterium]
MNGAIFVLTLRQLLGKRRAFFMVALAALPVLAAVIFRLADAEMSPQRWTADDLFEGLIVTILLPLITLVFGTTALGMEIEDGTVVYLLAKPLRRFDVIGAKLAAAWLPSAVLLVLSTLISTSLVLGGDNSSMILGFTIAVVVGSLAYCSVFMAASVFTSHSLIGGLIYVFLWEGVMTQLFAGTRYVSVRQYTLGVADLIADTSRRVFEAELNGIAALVLMAVVSAAAIALAVRRLSRFEMSTSA